MFSRSSRYLRLPDAIVVDEHGRSLPSKTLRLLPDVSGQFLHTVEESDRLDHLAYKYYQQPKRWWRICDANPDFLSPQALLGKEPIVTERFALEHEDTLGSPPWAELLRSLSETVGVMDVRVEEHWELVPGFVEANGEQVPISVDYYRRAVVVTYNTTVVEAAHLADLIEAAGFVTEQPVRQGRVGKPIVIPPPPGA